jgi:acyl carrier protein
VDNNTTTGISDDEVRARSIVLELVRAYTPVPTEFTEASGIFDDLGYNSLRVIELCTALQDLFSLEVVSVPEITTVASLQEHVLDALASGKGELPGADEVDDWLGRL